MSTRMVPRPFLLLKLSLVAIGAACIGLVVWKFHHHGGIIKIYVVGTLIPFAVLLGLAEWLDNRARRGRVVRQLARMGFVEEDPAVRAADVLYTPGPAAKALTVTLFAEAEWRGRLARFAELEYSVGGGKEDQRWRFFQASLQCPARWPAIEILPVPRMLQMVPHKAWKRGQKTGDPAFDALWRVAGDTAHIAEVLKPPLRDWLRSRSVRESWQIAGGWLACTWRGMPDEKRAEQVLARAATFLSKAGGGGAA